MVQNILLLQTIWSMNGLQLGVPVWLLRILPSYSYGARLFHDITRGTDVPYTSMCMQLKSPVLLLQVPNMVKLYVADGCSATYSDDVG